MPMEIQRVQRVPHKHSAVTELRMCRNAYAMIFCDIASRPPESGGILLGPVGSDEITSFYFDATGTCSGATYSPDHVTLNRKMKEEWLPSGIDMKGFCHSHPSGSNWLSAGDMVYIRHLLRCNPDMTSFAAPIVLPDQFRFCPYVVLRNQPDRAEAAQLVLF